MFTLLSNPKNVLAHLQKLSTADLILAKTNLTKVISALNVDVTELLANRKKHGVLLNKLSTDITNNELLETQLSTLLTCENHLISAINTLCLTEAILVRDVFSNTLELMSDCEASSLPASTEPATPQQVNKLHNSQYKQQQTNVLPTNNVAPIHLNDVKQRLTQALQPNTQQHEHIKNKLNALLVTDEPVHAVKKAI